MGRETDHAGLIADMALTLIGEYAGRIEALAFALPPDHDQGVRLARLAETMRESEQQLQARVIELTRSPVS
jgi:hypothetical protein